jgi:hypothetical protein
MCWSTVNTLTGGVETILAKANSGELIFVIGDILYMREDEVVGVKVLIVTGDVDCFGFFLCHSLSHSLIN